MHIRISITLCWYPNMVMKKVMLAVPEEMLKALEKERKQRYLETIPETVRVILSDYLKEKSNN